MLYKFNRFGIQIANLDVQRGWCEQTKHAGTAHKYL